MESTMYVQSDQIKFVFPLMAQKNVKKITQILENEGRES